jgi:DNA-binding transcriptional LysR family regulator
LPVISYGTDRERFEWRFDRGGKTLRVAFVPRLRVDSGVIALSACRAGLGVARLPVFLCAADVSSRSLVPLWSGWRVPSVEVWAYSSAPTNLGPTVREFIQRVRARLATATQSAQSNMAAESGKPMRATKG